MWSNLADRFKSLKPEIPEHHVTRMSDWFAIASNMALFGLLLAYAFDRDDNAFNRFFAANSIWPRFIVVGLAAIVDGFWKDACRSARIIEVYRRLAVGHARPENTILRELDGTCWSNFPTCFMGLLKHPNMWFEFVVNSIAILSDLNIIAVSGVLMNFAQTGNSQAFSTITSLIITGIMNVMILVIVFWWKRTPEVRTLPRKPETIGVVLSYLCGSTWAKDIAQMALESCSEEQRDEIILSKGLRYKFSKVIGEDERERWCIDYDDPHLGGYNEYEDASWSEWSNLKKPTAVKLGTSPRLS